MNNQACVTRRGVEEWLTAMTYVTGHPEVLEQIARDAINRGQQLIDDGCLITAANTMHCQPECGHTEIAAPCMDEPQLKVFPNGDENECTPTTDEPLREQLCRRDSDAAAMAFVAAISRGLTPIEKNTWLALYCRAKPDGTAQISQDNIASCIDKNTKTIRQAIARLEQKGVIKVLHRGGPGNTPAMYRIYSPCCDQCVTDAKPD